MKGAKCPQIELSWRVVGCSIPDCRILTGFWPAEDALDRGPKYQDIVALFREDVHLVREGVSSCSSMDYY